MKTQAVRRPDDSRCVPRVLREFIRERISVASRGAARKAIFMVQPAQNRRRDHLGVLGEAMTGGNELVAFEDTDRECRVPGWRLGAPGYL
jgi:hypothetical protein